MRRRKPPVPKADCYATARGRVAVESNVPVRMAQAWSAIGAIEINGDEIAKRRA